MSEIVINHCDILSDGHVRFYRQRTDRPFTRENIILVNSKFSAAENINTALSAALKDVKNIEARHPLAWNPEFGYVTADPHMCGTGLEINARFHLEGLHLIGDLEPALNALNALRISACGCSRNGLKNAAHLFRIGNASFLGIEERSLAARVSRVFENLVRQEANARIRLVEELPLLFEDAISRSLAILRNCRLLSECELLDIISPLKLAADLDFLENFPKDKALRMMLSQLKAPVPSLPLTYEEQKEQDRKDAALANRANSMFRSVRLNSLAKEWLP